MLYELYVTSTVLLDTIVYIVLRFSYKHQISKFIKNRPAFNQLKHEDWGRQDLSNPRD
jgi:hypothetical protein